MANKPITAADFQALWESSVDLGYSRPFIENPDTSNFEAWGQEFAQLERVSEAIDVTTQALFIVPWSGQSNDSAMGAQQATVMLTFQRTGLLDQPLIVDTVVFVEESTNDWGPDGPVPVLTGRRYSLLGPLVFNPGEAGPFNAEAIAERPGNGYNNPLPGTISAIQQPGSGLSNDHALYDGVADKMTADNRPDTPIPEHVGQYLRFTAGANPGAIKRVAAYGAADPAAHNGGVLFFDTLACLSLHGPGQYAIGETVTVSQLFPPTTYATALVIKQTQQNNAIVTHHYLTVRLTSGVIPVLPSGTAQVVGSTSGTTQLLDQMVLNPKLNDGLDESWEMVGWATGFGLTVTNVASPEGGRLAMLDALGEERKLPRTTGESDAAYAERVHRVADTISPNAVRRAGNRVLGPYGLSVCLREAGLELLPGFFFDRDAYDYDFAARPLLRNHVWFDYASMRAYFRIGVPDLGWGEFGFAYDAGPWNAYDTQGPTYLAFYDGFPWQAAKVYKAVYQAIAAVIAGGVGFDLYIERLGCT